MIPAATGFRARVLAGRPASRREAWLGRLYLGSLSLRASSAAVIGVAIVASLVLCAILAPVLAPYDPNAQALAERLKPPSPAHWLGTDEFGRDILSRIVHGSRVTLRIVLTVAAIAAPIGLLIGCVAG